jgi:hypothetical protein
VVKVFNENMGKDFYYNLDIVLVKTFGNSGLELKLWCKDIIKYFEPGEKVMVMSGLHVGGSGIITEI